MSLILSCTIVGVAQAEAPGHGRTSPRTAAANAVIACLNDLASLPSGTSVVLSRPLSSYVEFPSYLNLLCLNQALARSGYGAMSLTMADDLNFSKISVGAYINKVADRIQPLDMMFTRDRNLGKR